jgi:hypothetical protein
MMGTNTELYNADFYAWCSQKRELESRIHVFVMHLLTWRYQPEGRQRGHSWRSTIRTQRRELRLLLRDNPSLSPQVLTVVIESYPNARAEALDETGLLEAALPQDCPWTVVQILDDGFWPDT